MGGLDANRQTSGGMPDVWRLALCSCVGYGLCFGESGSGALLGAQDNSGGFGLAFAGLEVVARGMSVVMACVCLTGRGCGGAVRPGQGLSRG